MSIRQFVRNFALATALCANIFATDSSSLELVSKAHLARPASFGDSGEIELNADGKWAVFTSSGNGIVTNDHNGFNLDVFLRNNETGEITLVSRDRVAASGSGGDGNSYAPGISADGRFVVFESEAENLVPNDKNEVTDAFIYDHNTRQISLLSTNRQTGPLTAPSGAPVIVFNHGPHFALFETVAGLSPLDTNESVDLYRVNLGVSVDLVSTRSNDLAAASVASPSSVIGTFDASLSLDGRYIAFISSGTNSVPGIPANSGPQIFLRDMQEERTEWLTRSTNGAGAISVSNPRISRFGETVLFLSSSILPTSTTPPANSTFLYSYAVGLGQRPRLVTSTLAPVEAFSLSRDGRYVAYAASNQVYLHNLTARTAVLASHTQDGQPSSGVSAEPVISDDGRFVVFTSTATNLVSGPSDEFFQTYRFDRDSGEITLLSASSLPGAASGANNDTMFPVISGNGAVAGFMTYASNLTTNDNPLSNDIYTVSGTNPVTLASAPHPLAIGTSAAGSSYVEANALSLDGRFVIFSSEAPDVVANDTNSVRDIFLRNLQAGTTTLVSRQPEGTSHSNSVTFVGASLDAMSIAYFVNANPRHVYVYDRASASNTLASILPSGASVTTTGTVLLSPDGRYLTFRELSSVSSPLYIRDVQAGTTAQHPSPGIVSFGTDPVVISPSGRYLFTRNQGTTYALHDLTGPTHITNITSVVLASQPFSADDSTLLVSTGSLSSTVVMLRSFDGSSTMPIATNATPLALSPNGKIAAYLQTSAGQRHLYFYDARVGTSTPLTQDGTNVAINLRSSSGFSADSRYFAFVVTNSLVPVSHSFSKLYVYDTVLKTVRLAGVNVSGDPAESGVSSPTISANGRVLVFDTLADNLVPGDLNLSSDVFVNRFSPVDTDTDGLEDGWETINFGGLTLNGDTDSDNDGVSNRDEFLAGSDPNSASSILFMQMEVEGEMLHITAPASPGITYQLQFCADLSTGEWQNIGEQIVSLSGSVTFEAPLDLDGNGFYQIVVVN